MQFEYQRQQELSNTALFSRRQELESIAHADPQSLREQIVWIEVKDQNENTE